MSKNFYFLSILLSFFLFACTEHVPLNELDYSTTNEKFTKDGTPFTGIASSKTSELSGGYFPGFITSILLGDSISVEINNGNTEQIQAFRNGSKTVEIDIRKENGNTFTVLRKYEATNGVFSSGQISYECEYKNDQKHGKETSRKYSKKLGDLETDQIVLYENGLKNGKTTLFYQSNKVIFGDQHIKEIKTYKDDVLHGLYIQYYRDGSSIKMEKKYNQGKLVEFTEYSVNGVQLERMVKNSIENIPMNGIITTENRVGTQTTANYINGEKDGEVRVYYPNGDIWKVENYKKGVLHGARKKWYRNRELAYEANFANGIEHGEVKEYHKNGNNWKATGFHLGDTNGVHKRWYENEVLAYEGSYKKDAKEGVHKSYHQNGSLLEKAAYSNGKRNGRTEFFYEDGKKWKVKEYIVKSDGVEVVKYQSWYTNGNKAEKYTIVDGSLNGVYKKWYEDGTKRLEVEYKNGKKDGRYLNWEKNGTLYKDAYYKKDKEVN